MTKHDTLSRHLYYELVRHDHGDIYDIAGRIKEIDPGYFILWNARSGKWEVHNDSNVGGTYCFTVPYETLDPRTLDYCRQTLVSNDIERQIEEHNAKLAAARERARKNDMDDRTKEVADRMIVANEQTNLHEGYTRTVSMAE